MIDSELLCPCQSALKYQNCCQPLHQGQLASGPESLMRSRYSAYALDLSEYLLKTWFVTTRPRELRLDANPDWCALDVVRTSQLGNTGKVHFRAYYRLPDGGQGCLEERSDFRRHDGQWYYHSGRIR